MFAVPEQEIIATIRHALQEDIGDGDLTALLIAETSLSEARVISREAAVLCGTSWFDRVFKELDGGSHTIWNAKDGDAIRPEQVLCTLQGLSRALLSGERTALNFLQTLSGTATIARRYSTAVEGTGVKVLDTRKTLPGLRHAQKYAVRCGGCHNHRKGLFDAILIKENHIQAKGSLTAAVHEAKATASEGIPIEVEVKNISEFREALDMGVERLLLDNFDLVELEAAARETRGRAKLEASGGITLDNIRAMAGTGVDFISVGGLTKDVKAVDLSMIFQTPAYT